MANRPDEAEASYRQALQLAPHIAQIWLNFGACLAKHKRFKTAETAYQHALELESGYAAAWSNLGALYAGLNRDEEAERCHRTALGINPDYNKARFNLAYVLLRHGRFEEGWACLEARDWHASLAAFLDRQCSRWQGEPLAGKRLLVGYEGGHGDMIQFCRYIPQLKANGAAHITLLCHPALKTLFETLDGADLVIGYDALLPALDWDFWVPMLSLPHLCGTHLDNIPDHLPYLHADSDLIEQWSRRLPSDGLRVGLMWKGNPAHDNDADRSLPGLGLLEPLGNIPGIRFISLQKDHDEDETHVPRLPLWHLDEIHDFADSAAIISQLDLIITVDTAIAHLAGALGKPCWVMLPAYQTDWRWLLDRSDSPWYPNVMQLYRQRAMGDWASVIVEVSTALETFARR